MAKKKRSGWFREPVRHGLSARGVKTTESKVKTLPSGIKIKKRWGTNEEYIEMPQSQWGGWFGQPSALEKAMLERFKKGLPPVSNMNDVVEYIDRFESTQVWDDPNLGAMTNERLDKIKLKLKRGVKLTDDELNLMDWLIGGGARQEAATIEKPEAAHKTENSQPKKGKGPKYKSTDEAWQAAQSELAERYGEGGGQVGSDEGDEALKRKMGRGAF